MQNNKNSYLGVAFLFAFAGQATAGGLSDPIVPVPIVLPPVISQNDWYVGLQVGPGFGELSFDISDLALDGDADGVFYGVHAGVQRRFGTLTAGVELDYNTGNFQAEIE